MDRTPTHLNRRRLLARAGMLGAGAALGAAALRGADTSAQDTPAASPTPTEAPVQAGQQIPGAPTLTIWGDAAFVQDYAQASAQFSTDYGVNIAFQPYGFNDIITNFLRAAPTGNGPDLFDTNIDLLGQAYAAGLLAPVDFGAKKASFDDRGVKGWSLGQPQMYGAPLSIESLCMYRNPDLVPQPVTTWDQFSTVCADLLNTKGIPYPFILETNAYIFIGMLTAFGGYCFKYDPTAGTYNVDDVGLDNEGSIAAAKLLDQTVKSGWLSAGANGDIATQYWPQGQVGLMMAGPWQIEPFNSAGAKYVIDPLPAGPAGPAIPWLSARGFAVNSFSPNLALAQSFLTDYWASDAPMAAYAQTTQKESAWLPAKQSTATPTVQALIEASKTAIPIPSDPLLSLYWPAAGDAMTTIINQSGDATQTMQNAAKQVRDGVTAAGK